MEDLERAIRELELEYEKAKNNPTVDCPIAYALYHTWRIEDSRKDRKKLNERKREKRDED